MSEFGFISRAFNGSIDIAKESVLGGVAGGIYSMGEGLTGFLHDSIRVLRTGADGNFGEGAEILYSSIQEDLIGGVLGGAFGPEGIGGSIIGAAPEPVRAAGRTVVNPVFGAWDWTIQEVVDRPLGTFFTMVQVNPINNFQDPNRVSQLFDPSQWKRAWEINDKRTFGQSFIAGAYAIDPFDENEYNSIKDDPLFNLLSGTADFAQEFIDPVTYFGGTAVKAARGAAVIGRSTRGIGRTFAPPTRLGGHLLPRTGDWAPTRVAGKGLGIRPTTIAGKRVEGRFSFLTKTDAQNQLRIEIISDWTRARAQAVLDSPEWGRIEEALQAKPNLGGNERGHIIRQGLGRRGTKLPPEALRLIANGATPSARARTMRLVAGDNSVWQEIVMDARSLTSFLKGSSGRATVGRIRSQADALRKNPELDPDFFGYTDADKALIDGYSQLAGNTDWALVAAFEDSLILSQQKQMILDPQSGRYLQSNQVKETLREVPFDIQLAAFEDMLGSVDNVLSPSQTAKLARYSAPPIKQLPLGTRFAELLARQRDELLDDDFLIREYVNPNVIGGRQSKVRLISAKISRTHIDHTSSSAFVDFEINLTAASQMEWDGSRAINAEQVGKVLNEYQGYLTDGNFEQAASLYNRVIGKINKWVDDQTTFVDTGEPILLGADKQPISPQMRTLTDDVAAKQKDWKDPAKVRILSVTDPKPMKRKNRAQGSVTVEKTDDVTTIIHYGMSESQLRNADIMPRYDVVWWHMQKAIARMEGKSPRKIAAQDKVRTVGAAGQIMLENPNQIWRAAVLLTPKWPMRVALDEQLRLMSNLGTLYVLSNFNESFMRMRRTQILSKMDNAERLGDADRLAEKMRQIVLRRTGVDLRTEMPIGRIYDPVVEEIVRSDTQKIVDLDSLSEKQLDHLYELKGEHFEPDDLDFRDHAPASPADELLNSTDEVKLAEEAKLEEARRKGAEKYAVRKQRGDIVGEDLQTIKKGIKNLERYVPPGQEIIPVRKKGETAASYRNRLNKIYNELQQKRALDQKTRRIEDLSGPKIESSLDETSELWDETADVEPLAGDDAAGVFDTPADPKKFNKRMAEARPDFKFFGITFRTKRNIPDDSFITDHLGLRTSKSGVPNETVLDIESSWLFRLPSFFRPGNAHPDRLDAYRAVEAEIASLEKGYAQSVPLKVSDETADDLLEYYESGASLEVAGNPYEGLTLAQVNRTRKKDDLPPLTRAEFDEATGVKRTRGEGPKAKSAAEVKQEAKALELLRERLRNLGITPEESNALYRDWINNGTHHQEINIFGPRQTPNSSEVRTAIVRGDLNGMTLAVYDDTLPHHHGQVLRDLQLQHDPRTPFTIAVTGSSTIANKAAVWDALDEIAVKLSDKHHLRIIVMPDSHKAVSSFPKNANRKKIKLDNGSGADHYAYEWAKDRGVHVSVKGITDDVRFYEGMDRDWLAERGIYESVKVRNTKARPGQGKREVDYENLDQQVIQVDQKIADEYAKYKRELWADAANKRNASVLDEADGEVIFRHLRDPYKDTRDNKYYFAQKSFDDARIVNPARRPTYRVDFDEDIGFAEFEPSFEFAQKRRATAQEIDVRKTAREEQAEIDYYDQMAQDYQGPYTDDLGEALIREIDEELIEEYGVDYDPALMQERLRERNPQVEMPEPEVEPGPIDIEPYRVSLSEHEQRQAARDYEEYSANQKQFEDPELDRKLDEGKFLDDAAVVEEIFTESQYDFEALWKLLGPDGLEEATNQVIAEEVLTGRNLQKLRRNAGVKMLIGTGIVFGNPVMGAAWGFASYMSKRRHIRKAGQQKAALAYGSALRQQGRRLLDEATDFDDRAAARKLMSDADYIESLVAAEVRNAVKIENSFDSADRLLEQAGFSGLQIGNLQFRNAFGDDSRYIEQIHREVSANGGMSAIYSGAYKTQRREMDRYTKTNWERTDYTELNVPRDPSKMRSEPFAEQYDRLVNLYTSNSDSKPFNDIVWSNKPIEKRVEELYVLLTKDTQLLQRLVDDRGANRNVWLDIGDKERRQLAKNMVTEYENVLPTSHFPELRSKARQGSYSWRQVEENIDNLINEGRLLNGRNIQPHQNPRQEAVLELRETHEAFGKAIAPVDTTIKTGRFTKAGQKLNKIGEDLFLRYGSIPSDELARHPFFSATYEREMRRAIEPILDEDGYVNLSQKQIDRMENRARTTALAETKRVLYELSASSRAGELLGNASPFFNAWQEVTSRWAGFAVDNPVFVANVARLYRKSWEAEALGLSQFEDENGNTYVTLRLFGDAFDDDGIQSTIFDVMPESIKDVVIPDVLSDSEQTMRFSKDGINTMLQVTPGAGPLIVIPAREFVLAQPELEETLGFLFPFGHPQSKSFFERIVVANAPTYQKAVYDLINSETHSREAVTGRMFQDVVLEAQARGEFIDWANEEVWNEIQVEAEKRANHFFIFRIGAGLFSPTSTTWQSPYQPYMDVYNQLEKEFGWRMGQTMFLDRYGEEYFAATATFTRSNDKVASSIEAEALYDKYDTLIQGEGSSVGDWITGSMGSTAEHYKFSQSVYANQMNEAIAPGSDTMRRSRKTGREAIEDTQKQLGWRKYTQGKEFLRMHQDAATEAGLSSSLNSTHMSAIGAWWKGYKDELKESNPVWANEFGDIFGYQNRLNENIKGFAAGLRIDEIRDRPSSAHLLEYFQARLFMQDLLQQRIAMGGSGDLTANSNADLFKSWEDTKFGFSLRPEFVGIYDRYFERDTIDPITFIDSDMFPPGWFF